MPQPLKKYSSPIEFGPNAIDTQPALGVRIAKITAASTHLEMRLGLLLAAMLRAEAKAGVAMYLRLSGATSRNQIDESEAPDRPSGARGRT